MLFDYLLIVMAGFTPPSSGTGVKPILGRISTQFKQEIQKYISVKNKNGVFSCHEGHTCYSFSKSLGPITTQDRKDRLKEFEYTYFDEIFLITVSK